MMEIGPPVIKMEIDERVIKMEIGERALLICSQVKCFHRLPVKEEVVRA